MGLATPSRKNKLLLLKQEKSLALLNELKENNALAVPCESCTT